MSPYGGIVTPLGVGTTVGLEFFSSIFCTTPITGWVNWADGSTDANQSDIIAAGDCQCSFGPFTHTFNNAGTFNVTIGDTCDGSESIGQITVSETANVFTLTGLMILLGGFAGLGGLAGGLASLRRVRIPPPTAAGGMSASYPPTPVVGGSVVYTPTGPAGVAVPGTMNIPPPPAGTQYPAWAYDYRTVAYQPNPLLQGWPELQTKFQAALNGRPPAPPTWPFLREPAPPTDFPGTFCQPRINPTTGKWAWWNPIDGTFPWG